MVILWISAYTVSSQNKWTQNSLVCVWGGANVLLMNKFLWFTLLLLWSFPLIFNEQELPRVFWRIISTYILRRGEPKAHMCLYAYLYKSTLCNMYIPTYAVICMYIRLCLYLVCICSMCIVGLCCILQIILKSLRMFSRQ